jgi:2-polyprenyl-3-methyl-5-hydroxy-6-metoxy-1,4-benzoquinol methylase
MPSGAELESYYESRYHARQPTLEEHLRRREQYSESQVAYILCHGRKRLGGEMCALEIGCGAGGLLNSLRNAGFRVLGLEPDRTLAAESACRYGLDVRATSLEAACIGEQVFDLICLSHVLEHVPDPRDTLQRVRSLLKPGGLVFVEVPNDTTETLLVQATKGRVTGSHLYFFSPRTLQMIVEQGGFSPLTMHTCGMSLSAALRYWRLRYSAVGRLGYWAARQLRPLQRFMVRRTPVPTDGVQSSDRCYSLEDDRQGTVIRMLLVSEMEQAG